MKKQEMKANVALLLAAAIWGLAFVGQKVGIKYLGSFSINGIRFALGSLSLLLVIFCFSRNSQEKTSRLSTSLKTTLLSGICVGVVLFCAASLQQVGLEGTSTGKAAFITGLYIAFVPIFGVFLKHKINFNTFFGICLSVIGLYFLSVNKGFYIERSDLYEVIGAMFWAVHILLIDHFVKKVDVLRLSCVQFAVCSVLSLCVAFFTEKITIQGIHEAMIPILYTGICSVAGGYTLQAIGQKHAKPSNVAIILSLETVFATIGGIVILQERLPLRGYIGCILMLMGMVLSQVKIKNMKN